MSFTSTNTSSPNYISCYFILEPFVDRNNNIAQKMGRVTGSYDITYIENLFNVSGKQNPFTIAPPEPIYSIITNHPAGPSTRFIVGIPNKNNNNLSKKDIIKLMNFYNINGLRSIVPYVKTAGNDVTIPANPENCVNPEERKELVLKYKQFGNVSELTKSEITSIIDNLGIANRVCLTDTNYG